MRNTLLLLTAFSLINTGFGQEMITDNDALTGEMELIFDLSKMENSEGGQFRVLSGGELTTHKIENNILVVKRLLDEPRKIHMAFFPAKTIEENPEKTLSNMAVEASNSNEFLGLAGKYNIIVNGTLANIEIINESSHQKKYTELLQLKDSIANEAKREIEVQLLKDLQAEGIKAPFDGIAQSVRDSIISAFMIRGAERYSQTYKKSVFNFLKQHPDEPATLLELLDNSVIVGSSSGDLELKQLIYLYNNLTDRIKSLLGARSVYSKAFGGGLIDSEAPVFALNDPSGNLISLENYKGKLILLEFWASWCAPCRATNPELVKTYKKYHDKGFDILGVSLDDNKESWLEAIEKDGLLWTQVSSLNGFKSTAAKLYNVSGIPSNFLIDENGTIIKFELGIQELNDHLEKIHE